MRRRIPGLREAAAQCQEIPDGYFLVRVEKTVYRAQKDKPFLILALVVIEPRQFAGINISSRLYCTTKALWKLNWFLRDFGYDQELLQQDELEDKALVGLEGVVKLTHTTVNGHRYLNLEGFAHAGDWQEFPAEKAG
jgi:hypothetical protein